jgi:thioredoxin reductase/bacterioferritin-associated ferredoxin
MSTHYDYIIIGAGPAGLAAAVRARSYGLSVIVLDEQHIPGGQIYRAIERADGDRFNILGKDYLRGQTLVDRFRRSDSDYLPAATIWHISPDRRIYYLKDDKAFALSAKQLLIATGALERPVPIPGWTLPGIMGAGAIDVLFKSSALMPDGRVVMAGSGPLLYLVAGHLLDCNVRLEAILDTGTFRDTVRAARWLPGALRASEYLLKGLTMLRRIRQSGVPHRHGISALRAEGNHHVERVSFNRGHTQHSIETDFLILHDGVVPNTQITRLLACDHQWDRVQRYWQPKLDHWGNTSIQGIAVAGDTGGIYGARSAEFAGNLAAIDTAYRLNLISRQERDYTADPIRKKLRRERAVRPFLDAMFKPNPEFYVPWDDDTLVCRCEEVTAGQIRDAAAHGGMGPNQVKAKIRCGMGPCQGRMCGLTTAEIIAAERKCDVADIGNFRVRPPLKPMPLEALANIEPDEPSP